jgi:NADH-quinone oxidoreductase subunit A
MLSAFGQILLYIITGIVFVLAVFAVSKWLRPQRPNVEKLSTYESGEEPDGNANVQFNVRFYVIALIFVLFDVELVFLFPWATVFGQKTFIDETNGLWGWFSLVEMFVFVGLLALGLAYAWIKGHLDWAKPETTPPTFKGQVPADLYRRINEKYQS